jgi:hypothetical protein
MKRMMPILMALMIASLANAQPPDTLWMRTFGGADLDVFYDVKCTPDGGYIAAGETWSLPGHDVDWLVVKTDSMGHGEWTRTFGSVYDDRAAAVVVTEDGYTIAGHISGDTSRYQDFGLIHLNASGDSLWGHTYGGRRDDVCHGLCRTSDGGYALTGFTGSFGYGGGGGRDVWLLKTDVDGDSLWSHTYGGSGWDSGWTPVQTSDGGYAIGASTGSYGAGAYDMWLIKTDSQGDSLWSRTYGGGGFDEVRDMQPTADEGYILVGYTDSFGHGYENGYVVKTDSYGVMQWSRAFGYVETTYAKCVLPLIDGGYVIGGSYSYGTGEVPNWLLRTDTNGDSLWGRIWGSGQADGIDALALTPDGGYILAGGWNWDIEGISSGDAALTKTTRDPLHSTIRYVPKASELALTAYPNPFNPSTMLSFSLPVPSQVNIRVFDITGRLVTTLANSRFFAGTHAVQFDGSALASGVYIARIESEPFHVTQKLVLLR